MYTSINYEVWKAEGKDNVWHVYLHDQLLGTITKSEHGFFQVDRDEDMFLWPKFDLALFWAIRCASVVLSTAAYRRQHEQDDNDLMEVGEFLRHCIICGGVIDDEMAAYPEDWLLMQDGSEEHPNAPSATDSDVCFNCDHKGL